MRSVPHRLSEILSQDTDAAPPQSERTTLIATARRLRKTRAACQKFLALWALQQGNDSYPKPAGRKETKLNDPMNHDWSLLYLGSILDD